jgi:diadenylate cyclase
MLSNIIHTSFYLFKNLTLKDIVDIGLLSFIISLIFYSFSETKFLKVISGVIVIATLFLISNWYNLALTKFFFQSFFNVILVIIIIIFQTEIRKALEKFSLIIPKTKNIIFKKRPLIDTIIKSLKFFSTNRIGSLLVFENNDNLKSYIQNETRINADLSYPLLVSIFNKESPLHDGAVIIDKNKLKYAGAHLPLGEEYFNTLKRGTRHRAGTFITSETDAFSIIVSEETGQISLAEKGNLKYNVTFDEVVQKLNLYFNNGQSRIKETLFKEINYKSILKLFFIFLLSLIITFSFWIQQNFNKAKIQKIIEIPIEFRNLKDSLVIASPSTLKAKVIISAFETEFNFFDETKSKLIIDLNDFDEGIYNLSLNKENIINIPKTIEVINLEPKLIKFKLLPKATETSTTKNN